MKRSLLLLPVLLLSQHIHAQWKWQNMDEQTITPSEKGEQRPVPAIFMIKTK